MWLFEINCVVLNLGVLSLALHDPDFQNPSLPTSRNGAQECYTSKSNDFRALSIWVQFACKYLCLISIAKLTVGGKKSKKKNNQKHTNKQTKLTSSQTAQPCLDPQSTYCQEVVSLVAGLPPFPTACWWLSHPVAITAVSAAARWNSPGGRYHGGRRPSNDDSFHSPTVIPLSALDRVS